MKNMAHKLELWRDPTYFRQVFGDLDQILDLWEKLGWVDRGQAKKGGELFPPNIRAAIATTSDPKMAASAFLLENLWTIISHSGRIEIEKRKIGGTEPDWSNALKVAIHKLETLLAEMVNSGEYGGITLALAYDVVAWVNGEAFHNFSRSIGEGGLTGAMIKERTSQLKESYSSGFITVVTYDIAVAASSKKKNGNGNDKHYRASTGSRVTLFIESISEREVDAIFKKTLPECLGMVPGLPVVDRKENSLSGHIIGYLVEPLSDSYDWRGEPRSETDLEIQKIYNQGYQVPNYFDLTQMDQTERELHLSSLRLMVRGNLPAHVNRLLVEKYNGAPKNGEIRHVQKDLQAASTEVV